MSVERDQNLSKILSSGDILITRTTPTVMKENALGTRICARSRKRSCDSTFCMRCLTSVEVFYVEIGINWRISFHQTDKLYVLSDGE